MQRPHAEPTDSQMPNAIVREVAVYAERDGRTPRSVRQQDRDRLVLEPAKRELEYSRGRCVEPLHVVNGDENGSRLGQQANDAKESERDRTLIGRWAERVREE